MKHALVILWTSSSLLKQYDPFVQPTLTFVCCAADQEMCDKMFNTRDDAVILIGFSVRPTTQGSLHVKRFLALIY